MTTIEQLARANAAPLSPPDERHMLAGRAMIAASLVLNLMILVGLILAIAADRPDNRTIAILTAFIASGIALGAAGRRQINLGKRLR